MGSTQCNGGAESGRCFSSKGGFRTMLSTPKYTIGFRSSTFDVEQSNSARSKVD
jgi:hypothetical protein